MLCMMTEFLGDWPKPKPWTAAPWDRSAAGAGRLEAPDLGLERASCSCESVVAGARRALLLPACPSKDGGARIWDLGLCPQPTSIPSSARWAGHLRVCEGLVARVFPSRMLSFKVGCPGTGTPSLSHVLHLL